MARDDLSERVLGLKSRILAVESRAVALEGSVPAAGHRSEAANIIATLRLLEIALRGTPPADVVANAEEMFAAATQRLARVDAAS